MNDECDGSGTHVLCATLFPHRHCECGEPILIDWMLCSWCISEWRGISIMRQTPVKESRDNLNIAIPSSVRRRDVPIQGPTAYSPWEDRPEYKNTK